MSVLRAFGISVAAIAWIAIPIGWFAYVYPEGRLTGHGIHDLKMLCVDIPWMVISLTAAIITATRLKV